MVAFPEGEKGPGEPNGETGHIRPVFLHRGLSFVIRKKKQCSQKRGGIPMAVGSETDACSQCQSNDKCQLVEVRNLLARKRRLVEWRYYGRDCVVFRQNEPPSGLLLIHCGWLTLYLAAPGGKRVSLGVMGPGSVLGIGEIVNDVPHFATAETGEETELEFLAADDVKDALKDTPGLGIELLKVVARQDRRLLTQFMGGSRAPAAGRLWKHLLDLSKSSGQAQNGGHVRLRLSIQDLSDQIGCSRQWTWKLLADLEKKGSIRRQGGWIILLSDRAAKRRAKSLMAVPVAASGF
ncbi:MAG: Crp/Fnr family transcriptional regulator [Acidobacteriota bacterium]